MAVYSYARNLVNDNYTEMDYNNAISFVDHVFESVDLMIDAKFALFESSLDESYISCLSEDASDSMMTHIKAIGEKVLKFISSVLHFIMDKLQDILTAIIPRPENIGKKAPRYEYHDLSEYQVAKLQDEGFRVTYVGPDGEEEDEVKPIPVEDSDSSSSDDKSKTEKKETSKKTDSGSAKSTTATASKPKPTKTKTKSSDSDSDKDTDKDKTKDPKAKARRTKTKSNTGGGKSGKYYVDPLKYDMDKKFSVQVKDTYTLPEFSKLEEICTHPLKVVPLLDLREDMDVIYDRLKQLATRETGKRETNRIGRWKEDRGANKTAKSNNKDLGAKLKEYKGDLDNISQYFESQGFKKQAEVTVTDSDFKNMLNLKQSDIDRVKNKIINEINRYQNDYNKYSNSCTKQLDTLVHSSDKAVAKSASNLNKYYAETSKLVIDAVKISKDAISNYVGSYATQLTRAQAEAAADPDKIVPGGTKKDKDDSDADAA